MASELEQRVQQFRSDLLARDAAALRQMRLAYTQAIAGLRGDLNQALGRIGELQRSGAPIPTWRFLQEQHIRELIARAEIEFQRFATTANQLTLQRQNAEVQRAQAESVELIRRGFGTPPANASLPVNLLPTAALVQLQASLAADAPLQRLFDAFAGSAAKAVEAELVQGMAAGRQPTAIGRAITRRLGVEHSVRAQRIVRTEAMRAYREGLRATYEENSHLLHGWIWYSAMSARTCPVCLALHGKRFKTDQKMATHPNCRCSLMPDTKSWSDLGFDVPDQRERVVSGEDRFAAWSLDMQRRVLGPAAARAYQRGEVALRDFIGRTSSPIWGGGRRRVSLSQAVQNAAKRGVVQPRRIAPTPSVPRVQAPPKVAPPKPAPVPVTTPAPAPEQFPQGTSPAMWKDHEEAFRQRLTRDERIALEDYQGPAFTPINTYLRGIKRRDQLGSWQDVVDDRIRDIDSAIAKGAAPQAVTLYRGVSRGDGVPQKIHTAKVGDTWFDEAYLSTSIKPAFATSYAMAKGKANGVLMEIRVPKGHPMALVGTQDANGEIILARGQKFKVVARIPATDWLPERVVLEPIAVTTPRAKTSKQATEPVASIPWQSSMIKREGDDWSAQGAYAGRDLFHFTTPEAVDPIRMHGFLVGYGILGRMVYTTLARTAEGTAREGGGSLLTLRTNMKNPFRADQEKYSKEREKLVRKFTKLPESDPARMEGFEEYWLDSLKQRGYDGVEVSFDDRPGPWLLAFDRTQLTVIKAEDV